MNSYFRYLGNITRIYRFSSQTKIRLLRPIQVVDSFNIPCRSIETASPQERLDAFSQGEFFVALPEIPSDTPENNEALRLPREGDKPFDFSKLNFEKCYLAMGKTTGEFNSLIEDMNCMEDNDAIWQDPRQLFLSIEDDLYKMDTAYQLTYLLRQVKNDQFYPLNYTELPQKYSSIRREAYESNKIQSAVQNMAKELYKYDRNVQKMIQMFIQESKQYGSNVIFEDLGTLEQLEAHVKNNLEAIYNSYNGTFASFVHTIDDPDILKAVTPELSQDDSTHHKSRTPLQVNLINIKLFIRLCPDSELRRSFFRTLNRLCSPGGNPRFNIYKELENVRLGRRKIADSCKVRNYFELKRNSAHAQSKDLIMRTLTRLNETNIKLFKSRLNELSDYASSLKNDNYDGEIQEADLEYWINKYEQYILLGCTKKEMESNFPSDKVFQGLTDFLSDYFDIHIKQLTLDNQYVWNPDVKLYSVSYKDQNIGTFYYDLYTEAERQVSNTVQGRILGRSDRNGCKASLYLCHRMRKNARGENYMSQNEIKHLFYGMGIIVQELLCNEEFYELNIRGPFKPDTARILPNLFVTWLLKDPRILQSCSHNRVDGRQLDSDEIKKIIKYMTYFNCIKNASELYKSHLDIELNSSQIEASRIAAKVYKIYKPFIYDTTTYHYCSDLPLIASDSGMYYSETWSKVIATECFNIYQVPKEVSQVNTEIIKQTSERIIVSMFDTDKDIDLMDRLASVKGDGFNFSHPSLGVL